MVGAAESSTTEFIVLPADLSLAAAAPLWAALHADFQRGRPIMLDGSAVEAVSTSCLQVLVAARKAAEARAHDFALTAPSPALADAASALGLAGLLSIQED